MSSDFKEAPPGSKRRTPDLMDVLPSLGDATTAIFLLRDYEKFGLTERVCYHFDLTEALVANEDDSSEQRIDGGVSSEHQQEMKTLPPSTAAVTCGVANLLECAPVTPWQRLSKRQKRALKHGLRAFNFMAERVGKEKKLPCYQPTNLPLRLNPSTRMFFAYEVTRIAFCVDASPSMTSTYGVNGSGLTSSSGPCCPLDRLPQMARTFFSSLVEPVSAPSMAGAGIWKPILAVTVIAVFPLGSKAETSLLVRDYRVDSVHAAEVLADQIEKWIFDEVEVGISERLSRRHAARTWSMPLYSSSLRDILEAGDYALSVLSSEARPLIVVATDGRAISADGVVDVFLDFDRVDIPVIVLDTSLPETHALEGEVVSTVSSKLELNFLTYDPGGPSDFPLHLSDDTDALYEVCRATGGCFLDSKMLEDNSKLVAGQQPTTEAPTPYRYSYKRRFVKMNGLQWLTLFSLSPLSPTFHASSDKVAPPQYLQKRLKMGMIETTLTNIGDPLNFSRHDSFALPTPEMRRSSLQDLDPATKRGTIHRSRTPFSTYVVSPVRIKALLVMRIKEGYRAKQYGTSTQDADKVFIQFVLPLQMGTTLHYELSYRALSNNQMVGSAHIKIELSGDPIFVQNVKRDFWDQSNEVRRLTMAQKVSARLCQEMRGIRREDILQSYLSPPSAWSDQLAKPDSPLSRRLGSMTEPQRLRHFRSDEFDVICTGQMPYSQDGYLLSEFVSQDTGEQELRDLLKEWSTQVINENQSRYVKATTTSQSTTLYCLIELRQSLLAPRLFTLKLEFYGGTDPCERLHLLHDLKDEIESLKRVEVLYKQMGQFLVGTSDNSTGRKRKVDFQYHHARWDLIKDRELLPLVLKRRIDIGHFRLMQSSDNSAIFAKVVPEQIHDEPGDLIQYQIAILEDKVVVDLHMESECGLFFPFGSSCGDAKRFNGMVHVLRRRDQECGRALRSRTNLLSVLGGAGPQADVDSPVAEDHRESVKRMLQYSSRVSRRLRYFSASASSANGVLSKIIEGLLLSGFFSVNAAKLSILENALVKDEEPGLWFIIQFDRHTLSIAHLSAIDHIDTSSEETCRTYRSLTFFTSGISDLYSKREDTNDDDSVDSHISEYLCVTEFAEHFESAEKKNFASAAYSALRNEAADIDHFEKEDLNLILDSLNFHEVASVLVSGHGLPNDSAASEQSKLLRLIETILSPVPGNNCLLFYSGNDMADESFNLSDEELDSLAASSATTEPPDHEEQDIELEARISEEDYVEMTHEHVLQSVEQPMFVRFKLDGGVVPFESLRDIRKSASLSAEVSLLKNQDSTQLGGAVNLPRSHQAVASELNVLLKWYVAEQTIERLRHHGPSISEENLRLVKKCMKRVQSLCSFSIEVFFYVSRSDMMVPASAPAGGEAEVAEGFLLLGDEIRRNQDFDFKPVASGGFFVSNTNDDKLLAFWCFIYVHPSQGLITSQIYHPDGEGVAVQVMSRIHDSLRSCLHRVNQKLLLNSLHRNRTASQLMIGRESLRENANTSTERTGDEFPLGFFSCPVVFDTTFSLFHRCASNPGQVAHNLEATVLHSFAVSNRPGLFVYKDEGGEICYMQLHTQGSGLDNDGQVKLLVYGMQTPGPSVTEQLRAILQRRILQISVEMLSSVLTKNPHFRVSAGDLDFLRSFDKQWAGLTNDTKRDHQDRLFEFPSVAYDPVMVLLMFRQNLCGSTFFHRLNDIGYEKLSPSITESSKIDGGGCVLQWNQHDFTLYYNNAPSKLDHAFQGISTLTEKGAELSRQVGAGIAMIEILLLRSDGNPVDKVHFAEPGRPVEQTIGSDIESIRFRRIAHTEELDKVCVRVRITDTALSRNHLHEWIELTLNQALTAWVVERRIEESHTMPRPQSAHDKFHPRASQLETSIENLCPGLPTFHHLLRSSYELPHPAVKKVENTGVIRASQVSTKTLTLLEACVFGSIIKDKASDDRASKLQQSLRIVRLSRLHPPQLVRLQWDKDKRKAIVHIISDDGSEKDIVDSPIDCPEYICFYQDSHFGKRQVKMEDTLQLYKEVMIHDGISDRSDSIELLEQVKAANRQSFMRSFGFIFSMKRNRRILFTYNWNPNLVKSIKSRLEELETSYLEATGRASHSLQFASLRILSPPSRVDLDKANKKHRASETQRPREPRIKESKEKKEIVPARASSSEAATPPRRIRRPVTIRRPKLVGQSVEGSAIQAVAASRKRASSNQFKNVANSVALRRTSNASIPKEVGKVSASPDLSLKRLGRPPTLRRTSKARDQRDEDLVRVATELQAIHRFKSWGLRRELFRHSEGLSLIAGTWWPQKVNETVPLSAVEFILARTPHVWNSICRTPPVPEGAADSYIATFARWIAIHSWGLRVLPVTSTKVTTGSESCILLASVVKNVRGRKCFVVIKLAKIQTQSDLKEGFLVRSEGWVVTLPRRSRRRQVKKLDSNVATSGHLEKDAAGMDRLAAHFKKLLALESLLFDFSASIIERNARQLDDRIAPGGLVPSLRSLMARCPLEKQKRLPALNFRVFEAHLVLQSYNDAVISKYDSVALFNRLHIESSERDLVRCGAGVCFKRGITVKGSQSLCFLTPDPAETSKMRIIILCRTQGQNLSDYMFWEGSNVAIHILDNIVLEAADLVYEELKYISTRLQRESLWASLLHATEKKTTDAAAIFDDVLNLSIVRSILESLGTDTGEGAAEILSTLLSNDSGIDWIKCCQMMEKQKNPFGPCFRLQRDEFDTNIMFFISSQILLAFDVDKHGLLKSANMVEKDMATTAQQRQEALQAFADFLLRFIWQGN